MSEPANTYITEAVTQLIEPVLAELGLELVEVQFRREKVGWVLRLIIHRRQGVTIDDCTRVSREVSNLLDVEDLIDQPYHLEVSSPGLDRPLKTARDFSRHQGEKVKVVSRAPVEEQQGITGLIESVNENEVIVAAGQDKIAVPLDQIVKAKLVIEF